MNRNAILNLVQSRFPNLLALYAFGSRVTGQATSESDLDLAILVDGPVDPFAIFTLAGEIAESAGLEVDLGELRAASTVMQHQ
ncbi:MAG: type VII toxin-antitoxin system MntA family adenylyltransferase antitoxin, partial [Acidobacteriota bacterium]